MMTRNSQQEEFSYAYIKAVASASGFSAEVRGRVMDGAGLDMSLSAPGDIGEVKNPQFDAQVKCTASEKIIGAEYIKFPLKVKNYQQLINPNRLYPVILIVVLVPEDIKNWLNISEEETLLKRCGYWLSLKGKQVTNNVEKITVDIPRKNLFTPVALSDIMNKIGYLEELQNEY